MVSASVVEREVRSLCKEIRKACHQLPEGPTTTNVRATSSKLFDLLRRLGHLWSHSPGFPVTIGDLYRSKCGRHGRATKLHLLLVETGLVPHMLQFLLWSLPLLPRELSDDPEGPAYQAWSAAADILMALAGFGCYLAVDEPAAGSALLGQVQPASDLSKPGE